MVGGIWPSGLLQGYLVENGVSWHSGRKEPFALIEEKTLLFVNCIKETKVFLRVWERSG